MLKAELRRLIQLPLHHIECHIGECCQQTIKSIIQAPSASGRLYPNYKVLEPVSLLRLGYYVWLKLSFDSTPFIHLTITSPIAKLLLKQLVNSHLTSVPERSWIGRYFTTIWLAGYYIVRSIGLIESIRKALVGHLVISSSLDAKVVFLNSAICLQEVHIIPFASEVKISYFGTKRDQSLCTNEQGNGFAWKGEGERYKRKENGWQDWQEDLPTKQKQPDQRA